MYETAEVYHRWLDSGETTMSRSVQKTVSVEDLKGRSGVDQRPSVLLLAGHRVHDQHALRGT